MPISTHAHPDPKRAQAAQALRVLIVDDQLVVRGVLRSALEKLDRPFLVIEAPTGEEALDIMRNTRIDIIFCDIQLPGLSGPEALAYAYGEREKRPFMVLMSAAKSAKITEIGQHVGVYEFLPKPFRAADVHYAVAAYDRLSRSTRALLVDDSATARKLMRRILARSQFALALEEAESGEAAVALAKAGSFDVIFCDFNMPGLDGVETAGQLLQANPNAQIVIISTEQQASTVRSAQFVGACAFLKKPFDATDVDAVLHEAFSLKRPSIARPTHAIISRDARDVANATG